MSFSVPLPDVLLAPLIESAGDTLRALEATDVPSSLRHLQGFDRRGLMHGPAPRQVLTTLERNDTFREKVIEQFRERSEVAAMLDEWDVAHAVRLVDAAEARGDLALLASALWAARPEGCEYGLGLVHAQHERNQRERTENAELQAQARTVDASDEARRRADAARMAAETELERVERELRDERRARRAREDEALADANTARRSAEGIGAQLGQAQAALHDTEGRLTREARRVKELEESLRVSREEADALRGKQSVLPAVDARALTKAAAAARDLASTIEDVAHRTASETVARPKAKAAGKVAKAAPRAPARRTTPALPGGVLADSAMGAEAMLRTEGVNVVVDGYNVTKRAWPDATAREQRERLAIALAALHTRLGCSSTVVFDGDGTTGPTGIRRRGLRVLFSGPGDEADDIVVQEVARLPKRVPVVVASSDAWVREHAEKEGAVVISAAALLAVFR
ncbi:MAG: hypothetical protein JWL83_988 [Actinomycetia bacterium]|nr:hypothetical protein [Actinomycetes bacterium]